MQQATFEYGEAMGERHEIPEEAEDTVEFALGQARKAS